MSFTRSIVWLNTNPVVSAGRGCTPGRASSFCCRLIASRWMWGNPNRCGRRRHAPAVAVAPVGEEPRLIADRAQPAPVDRARGQAGRDQALARESVEVDVPVPGPGGGECRCRRRVVGQESVADLRADLVA